MTGEQLMIFMISSGWVKLGSYNCSSGLLAFALQVTENLGNHQ